MWQQGPAINKNPQNIHEKALRELTLDHRVALPMVD
jgi:hypothetical protein